MIRAAIYARVSTDQQAQDGDSIPAQLDALQKYVEGRQDMVLAGTYVDDGISGRKIDRDELQRLLDDVKADKVDVILFTKLDRWFRSVRHYATTQDLLDQHKVTWTAIWEPVYDTTTPTGRLIVNQMMSFAQFEAENTSQRIRSVMAYKVAQGEAVTGSVPYGYRIQDKRLVIVPEDAEKVRALFEHYRDGGSLNDSVRFARSTGMPQTKQTIKAIFQNRKYIGYHRGNPNYCPAIISTRLWEDVQRRLATNIKTSTKYDYLFVGLVECACCHRRIASGHRMIKTRSANFYRCPRYYATAGRPRTCDNKKFAYESHVEEYLLSHLRTWAQNRVLEYEAGQTIARDNSARISALNKRRERLTELYLNEMITMDDLKMEREKIDKEIQELTAEQVPLKKDLTAIKELLEIKDIEGLYNTFSASDKRFFWRSILSKITFDGASISVEFL